MKRGTKEQNKKDNNVATIFYSHSFFFPSSKAFQTKCRPSAPCFKYQSTKLKRTDYQIKQSGHGYHQ